MSRHQPVEETGFLLTRQALDRQGRCELQFWVTTESGPALLRVPDHEPLFFLPQAQQALAARLLQDHGLAGRLRPLSLKTFAQQPVCACYFPSLSSEHRARTLLTQQGLALLEADIRAVDRYLMERFITAGVRFTGEAYQHAGYREVLVQQLAPAEHAWQGNALSLDVECAPDGRLLCVGLCDQDWHTVILVGSPRPAPADLQIEWVADERSLLQQLGVCLRQRDPDLLLGWNLVNFDCRLLLQRLALHGLAADWGRAGQLARFWPSAEGKDTGTLLLPGRVAIDGIAALKSAGMHFDSYALESVARQVLGEGKALQGTAVQHREQAIVQWHQQDPVQLARYNLQDCRLVWELFARLALLPFLQRRAQLSGLALDRPGGSVAAFSHLYLPRLHRRGYVAPDRPQGPITPSPGGYVMDSVPGLYRHVLVLDFKSLYPSLIRTFAIDPLALVEGLRRQADTIPGFLAARFAPEVAILPGLLAQLWQARDQAKAQQDAILSQAIKLLMNSFYGVLGSPGCRFFDARLASSITLRGQWLMQQSRLWLQGQGYQVIYGDTDSIFVWLTPEQVSDPERQGSALAATINAHWRQRLADEFGVTSCLELQFERHYARFFMPTIRGQEQGSKKRYAGLVSGAQGDELIFKGLESIRSDWTELAKQFQQGLYWRVFHDEDVAEFVQQMVHQTRQGELDHWLVYHKKLRRPLAAYRLSQPPHVKAAIKLEAARQAAGLPPLYTRRGEIDYYQTLAGPEPVGHRQQAIDYQHYIDKQLRPVAEAILPWIGLSFDGLAGEQLSLF
ncbi:DNA polymerase II [Pseudaeromonas sp. ZJS20]|uniref:DNA polymerase II n=1 Tax=Pseudaeromonas aegiceratis TaxID=3153928 RepID=UPI00390C49FE